MTVAAGESEASKKAIEGGELVWVHDGRMLRARYARRGLSNGEANALHETFVDPSPVPETLGSR